MKKHGRKTVPETSPVPDTAESNVLRNQYLVCSVIDSVPYSHTFWTEKMKEHL